METDSRMLEQAESSQNMSDDNDYGSSPSATLTPDHDDNNTEYASLPVLMYADDIMQDNTDALLPNPSQAAAASPVGNPTVETTTTMTDGTELVTGTKPADVKEDDAGALLGQPVLLILLPVRILS